jgi:hypothetical protein
MVATCLLLQKLAYADARIDQATLGSKSIQGQSIDYHNHMFRNRNNTIASPFRSRLPKVSSRKTGTRIMLAKCHRMNKHINS